MRCLTLLFSAVLVLVAGATPLLAEQRIALVIGNADYKPGAPLATPRNDADAVAAALRDVGFQSVRIEHDLNRDRFVRALRAFSTEADKADWAVVYFAGYGIQVASDNHLIPIEAELRHERDVGLDGVLLRHVVTVVSHAKKLGLVLLDASRDSRRIMPPCTKCVVPRGLAPIEPEVGTLVSFSAKGDTLAVDGEGNNSPYVTALLNHIRTPGLDLTLLFQQVRDDVLTATVRRQEPFVYGAVPKEPLFFVKAGR
jgi:uncharacterized caspase-like protein